MARVAPGRRDRSQASRAGAVLPGSRAGAQPDRARRRADLLRPRPAMRALPRPSRWSRTIASPITTVCSPSSRPGMTRRPRRATKKTAYPEKAAADLAFDSVFVKGDHHLTGPRVPGGPELAEPVFPPGDEYRVKPAAGVLAVPRHSRTGHAGLDRHGRRQSRVQRERRQSALGDDDGTRAGAPGRPGPSGQPAQPPGAARAAGGGDRRAQVRRQGRSCASWPSPGPISARSTCPRRSAPSSPGFVAELAELKGRSAAMEAAAERAPR